MISKIIEICDNRYREYVNESSNNCTFFGCSNYLDANHYVDKSSIDFSSCSELSAINSNCFPKYGCEHVSDYYVCRYSRCYSTEIQEAFKFIFDSYDDIPNKLKIMSLGCGPCNDLFAFDKFSKKRDGFENIELTYEGWDYESKC